jgi:thioredoxin-related protein
MLIKKISLLILLHIGILYGDSNLTIYRDYNQTVEIAKKENKPIFILFSKKNCQWCKKLKSNLTTNGELKSKLKDNFLVLFLDKEKDYYPSKYKVPAVPDVFLISEKEEIYTEIFGYHKKERDYLKWLRYVRIERE